MYRSFLNFEAQFTLDRLKAARINIPALDRARCEDAVMRHLAAVGMAPRPTVWFDDAEKALLGASAFTMETAHWVPAIKGQWDKFWTIAANQTKLQMVWNTAREHIWSDAESAIWTIAKNRTKTNKKLNLLGEFDPAGISTSWSSVVAAAYAAVESVDNVNIWMPIVDAFEAGLWLFWIMDTAILAVPKPHMLTVNNRLHCEIGPAAFWPNGARYWFWRGMQVEQHIIEQPELITVEQIDRARNSEVQRIMIERFGWDRYAEECKAEIIDHDERWGTLYRKRTKLAFNDVDADVLFLRVTNRSPEPDGQFKKYILPVAPRCQPLPDPDDPRGRLGRPQKLTALNAVASTFGMRGRQYANMLGAES